MLILDLHATVTWGNQVPWGLGAIVVLYGVGALAFLAFRPWVDVDRRAALAVGAAGCALGSVSTRLLLGWWGGLVPEVIFAIAVLGLVLHFKALPGISSRSSTVSGPDGKS
jgi:hypothetical protein